MEYGRKYKVERLPGIFAVGEMIQTRGNDQNFPTFILEDGTKFGCDKKFVIEEVEDAPDRDGGTSTTEDS